ncbi:MAG: hypothetical protein WCE94_11340 [Candidatus Methanoperedens sp.]
MRKYPGKNKAFDTSESERFLNILLQLADNTPTSSPFTIEGAQEWREWEESSRAEHAIDGCE